MNDGIYVEALNFALSAKPPNQPTLQHPVHLNFFLESKKDMSNSKAQGKGEVRYSVHIKGETLFQGVR